MLRVIYIVLIMSIMHNVKGQIFDHDVYMLGNLCDVANVEPVITSLNDDLSKTNIPATIVLNGDMTSKSINTKVGAKQLANLKALLAAFGNRPEVSIYLLAGDRDWNDNKEGGYKAVLNLEEEIEDFLKENEYKNIEFIIGKGCPGPHEIAINRYTTMIAINSQWWNQKHKKPEPSDAICKYIINADIMEEIDDIIGENANKNILIASHHPMRSLGNYGGRYSLADNIKPFPIVATFKNAFNANVGGQYSINNKRLKVFTELMYNELYFKTNVIFASGHEKNHQIHQEVDNVLLNSGAIAEGSYSPKDYLTSYHTQKAGFIKIEYKVTGAVSSTFVSIDNSADNVVNPIFSSACVPGKETEELDPNQSYIPCVMNEDVESELITNSTTTILPGEGYEASWIKKIFLGEHHRPTWSTPVTVPYLRISESYKDLTPYEKGGGRQTISLKFKNEDGKRFTFRSVDKEPRKALNYELRQSFVGGLFEDQTSAQHPFGAIPVGYLLEHLDILHANPKLYVIPDTEALGPYQPIYGGMLGMLEENPGKPDENGEYFGNADDILKSNKLFHELYEDKEHEVRVDEFIRARLFDILVGDWSKHEDNWKWAEFKKGDKKLYRPIPRDRDHVFSKWDGILPWIADREWLLPNTEGFDKKISGFQSAVYQARFLDRFIVPEAELEDYIKEAKYIQDQLTDERILKAIKQMPEESFAVEGDVIVDKLITRRDDLLKYAKMYFQWLNQDVEILGSAKDDYFEIFMSMDTLVIEIWDEKKGEKGTKKLFERKLHASQTDIVRIYGLGEEDIYKVDLERDPNIEVVLLGGDKTDVYRVERGNNYVEVVDEEENISDLELPKWEIDNTWDRHRFAYNRNGKKFNSYFPLVMFGYNAFNGLNLRASNTWTRQRWDKPDFHQRHRVGISASFSGDYGLKYEGITRHAYKKWDYVYNAIIANPDFFDSYYGQGNLSLIDPLLDANNFYIATYNNYKLMGGLRRQFWNVSTVELTTGGDFFVNKTIENTILEGETNLLGANEQLMILPVKFDFDLDFRDDSSFPRRGSRLTLAGYHGYITNREWQSFAMIGGSIEQYFTTYNHRPLTLGLKLGGMKGLGEVPFYLQPRLGGNNLLRGYTSNRFFARSALYMNSELRWEVFRNNDATIPYILGVSSFYDLGKVSNEGIVNTEGNRWHYGYGGGLFFVPFNESLTISIYLAFSDENSFYPQLTFGTALN